MSVHVVDTPDAELWARRRALLAQVGLTGEELAERADRSSLVGDEWAVWEEVQEIDYLLG